MNIFLDANVLIDIIDENRERHQKAKEVIKIAFKNANKVGTSEDIITTIFYATHKKVDKVILMDFIESLNKNLELISFGKDTISKSTTKCKKFYRSDKDIDFEDVLQVEGAKKYGYDIFISSDKKLQKEYFEEIKVFNLDEFIELYFI